MIRTALQRWSLTVNFQAKLLKFQDKISQHIPKSELTTLHNSKGILIILQSLEVGHTIQPVIDLEENRRFWILVFPNSSSSCLKKKWDIGQSIISTKNFSNHHIWENESEMRDLKSISSTNKNNYVSFPFQKKTNKNT